MRALVLALLVGLNARCTTQAGGHQAGHVLGSASTVPPSAAPSSRPALVKPASPKLPGEPFLSAMRSLDWQGAEACFTQLPEALQQEPKFQYARAYAAERAGEHTKVLDYTRGLDEKLPECAPELARMRAHAELHSAPLKAADFFAQQNDASDLLLAARALRSGGALGRARQLVDRALSLASKQKGNQLELLAELKSERIQIARAQKQLALVVLDLRWLALEAPTAAAARAADVELERFKGQTLSKRERYARALAFAENGSVVETEAELSALDKAPGPALGAGELTHARARARYASRDYLKAAELFDTAVALGTQHKVEDSFHAARALSRADKDLLAIERYKKFAASYPSAGLAEDAHYLIPRLYYVLGDWQQATLAYNKYLTKFSKRGRFLKTARYELAVAELAAKDFDKASKGFDYLLKDEDNERLGARYRLLNAVALLGGGNRTRAVSELTRIITELPLSFAALAAAARLTRLGETPPPAFGAASPGQAPAPLNLELPEKVNLLLQVGLDQLAERELEKHEAKLKQRYRPREYESLCTAYAQASGAARRYRIGEQAANWSLLTRAPNPSTRWLWDCVYPKPYAGIVSSAHQEFSLPPHLLYAVMRQESGFRPEVVSPAKAVGLMQLIPPTAERVATALGTEYQPISLQVPRHNIRFGAYYLKTLLDMFGHNVALAAAAYNAGPKAVSHWLEGGEALELDVFVARIPYRETRTYVERVLENLARYAYLEGGLEAVPELVLEIPSGLRAAPDAY